MVKKNNKGIIIVILLIAIGLFFFFNQDKIPDAIQSVIVPDLETQLRQEYATYWGDSTDGSFSSDKFTTSGGGFALEVDSITITASFGRPVGTGTITLTQKFKGQEVVTLIEGCAPSDKRTRLITKYIPHTFDTSIYDVIQNGVKINEIDVGDSGLGLSFRCDGNSIFQEPTNILTIEYIGYKAEFDCDITPNEVWITERYGSRVNLDDLTFVPSKLCYNEHPPTLRKLSEGETKIFPNPYFDLNVGKTIPDRELLSDEVITIRYATFFVEGVIDPLPPNQEYVCTQRGADNKCSNWVIQQFVDPLTLIVQCQQNSDCPQPLKNLCPDYFTGCQNSFCTYDETILNSEVCKNEVVTIIKEIEKIQERELILVTGTNIFPFAVNYPSGSFGFGDEKFEAEIDFTCDIPEEGITNFPNPNPDCWKGEASFESKTFDLIDGDVFNIRDNIEVTYFAGGSVKFIQDQPFNTKKGLSSTFIFSIIGSPLDIDLRGGSEVLKDSEKTINFTIKNNLPKGTLLLKITSIAKQTNQILPEIREERSAQEGDIEISFPMDTTHLGLNEFVVQTFYKMVVNGKEVLLPSDKIKFNMGVVTKLSNVNPEIIVITEVVTEEKIVFVEVKKEGIPVWVKVIGGLVAGFVILKLFNII